MTKKTIKYGKSYDNLINIKNSLLTDNDKKLNETIKINKIYSKLKKRSRCIICKNKIKKKDFISHKIEYAICQKCGHLNGKHLMDTKFNEKIYLSKEGKNYFKNYEDNYFDRVNNIYLPKIKFLRAVIKKKFKLIDFGCGGGHFVKGCEKLNIQCEGIDPNLALVNLGRKFLKKNFLKSMNFNSCLKYAEQSKADVLSLIFVLEHLTDPNDLFKSFKKSNIQYLYFSVPLFSLSVFLEQIFQNVYPRQLGGYHTNLYSYKSINYLCRKYNLKIIGEWWFGSDFFDLDRSILANLNSKSLMLSKSYFDLFKKNLNNLQYVLDKSKSSSELHIVLKKK